MINLLPCARKNAWVDEKIKANKSIQRCFGRGASILQYNFETLGDERFQHFCQALLTEAFPDVQCLPVGQRDGGRDGMLKRRGAKSAEVVVFQVKFVRDPSTRSARDFIEDTIRSEKPKIEALKSRGAVGYYLLTNAIGSSFPDFGSIDKVEAELSAGLGIHAKCWWRDDLERRLDANDSVKWSYPDVIRATDLLQVLCNFSNQENVQRRLDALKAFMVSQYRYDDQLKFKQINLQKSIADIFVDVPARLMFTEEDRRRKFMAEISSSMDSDEDIEPSKFLYDADLAGFEDELTALRLLSDSSFTGLYPFVVVEGAPGQGKSTITQFLCQIHRMIWLGKSDLAKVRPHHRPGSVRIPIRVDLRDYASWVSGIDPFADKPESARPEGSTSVLESFLCHLIYSQTGRAFNVDDLAAVSKASHLLVVLDGFDEVADVQIRNRLVNEISDASARIKQTALSAQIIVTSRPAAFANSPGFSKDEFQYVELASLTESVIFEYSEKWLDGRETDARERRDITAVLTQKLKQPHVRDLARNPMQLAILLNLISVRGASLPDKRTALYDSYIDIFLNREADKSEVVRDHRSELLKIHRFLAWLLQSEAESERGRGQITEQRLRQVLLQFLENEGHATELVDSLFQGVVERVFVLVSRVQGTFEFEVQPLREYFAARYLYDTAPYSPAGITVRGTLPDRFVALARNFYWLNVTRFFAGCYSSGELASLKYGIRIIQEDPDFERMSHLPEMMLTLIKDYVFADQPLLSEEITELLIGDVFFSHLLARRIEDKPDVRLEVPRGRSRQVLVRHLVSLLTDSEKTDRSYVISKSLGANLSSAELLVQWKEIIKNIQDVKTQAWIAQVTDLLPRVSVSQFREIFELVPAAAFKALQVGRVDLIDCDQQFWRHILNTALLQKHYYVARNIIPKTDIGYFALTLLSILYFEGSGFLRNRKSELSAWYHLLTLSHRPPPPEFDRERFRRGAHECFGDTLPELVAVALDILYLPTREVWANKELWIRFFGCWQFAFGSERGLVSRYVALGKEWRLTEKSGLAECSQSGSALLYAAALRSASAEPRKILAHLRDLTGCESPQLNFALVGTISYVNVSQLVEIRTELEPVLRSLSADVWKNLCASIENVGVRQQRLVKGLRGVSLSEVEPRFAAIVIQCSSFDLSNSLLSEFITTYDGNDPMVLHSLIRLYLRSPANSEFDWSRVILLLKKAYESDHFPIFEIEGALSRRVSRMPLELARTVCTGATHYPLELVAHAERVVAAHVGSTAFKVADISRQEAWFGEGENPHG